MAVNLIGVSVALYFIADSASSLSSSDCQGLMLVTFLFVCWIALCWYLYKEKNAVIGLVLAWIPAVPLLLYALFILMFIILQPDMR